MIPTQTFSKPASAFPPLPASPLPSKELSHAPTHAQIATCAYDIYIEHGRADGRCKQNWHQAEEELTHKALTAAHKSGLISGNASYFGPIFRRRCSAAALSCASLSLSTVTVTVSWPSAPCDSA